MLCLQEQDKPCTLVKVIALSRKRIEMRVSIARMESLTCLSWLNVSATSAGHEKCPLTYEDLKDLKVGSITMLYAADYRHGACIPS